MSDYQLISDYKQIEKYKKSFNELAKHIFGLDFKEWYDKGCWNDNYICYSYLDGDNVIANASVNKMVVVSEGKEYNAIQLGTVMTHPAYRHQGLAAKLMNHIIKKYEKNYDFIYLFANETVLDFYPKFGFEPIQESSFSLKASDLKKPVAKKITLRKLDVNNKADFELMKEFAAERITSSSILGVKDNEHLLMFYFILAFADAVYYIEEEDVIIIFKEENHVLHIVDVITKKRVEIDKILTGIVSTDTEIIKFYFTPDLDGKNIHTELITESDDLLFVCPLLINLTSPFLFPLTSHA